MIGASVGVVWLPIPTNAWVSASRIVLRLISGGDLVRVLAGSAVRGPQARAWPAERAGLVDGRAHRSLLPHATLLRW